MSNNRENSTALQSMNSASGDNIHHLASMMRTAVHTAILLDSKFQLVSEVNIDLLQPDDLDISLVADAVFREFLLGIGEQSEEQLKKETRKVRLSGESSCLNVEYDQIGSSQHYEVYIRPLIEGQVAGTHCVLHIHEFRHSDSGADTDPTQQTLGHVDKRSLDTRLMHDIFSISSDAIIIFNRFQKVILKNPAFEKLLGRDHAQLKSSDDVDFFSNRHENLNNKIWQSLFYENHWSGEVYLHNTEVADIPFWLTVDSFYAENPNDNNDRTASHYLFSLRDISELKKTQVALEHSATHDQLTGLPNRAYFLTQLKKAIHRADRQETTGALLFIDLDNFKLINDSKGHAVGDVVLLMMATRLKKIFRNGEIVARLGGDEFTLIAEDIKNIDNAAMVAQRILEELNTPFVVDSAKFDVQCSIGISLFPDKDCSAIELIKKADTAMYAAKSGGKNNFQLYDSELTKETARVFSIETHIRNAIENNELALYYQPQFDMKTKKIVGAEALLRWHNSELGPVSPSVFIPIIESAGMIDEIGHWVLDNVCQQIGVWKKFSAMQCIISVNASRLQLVKSNFIQQIVELLEKHWISGHQLEIEVTENAFTESETHMIDNLHLLREMGCKIAIDDFGTGYSSLANLQSFPLDRLKIDRSFVEKIEHDPAAITIASAIVSLGKSLGLSVIAEGVENKAQVKQLLKMGCRHAQGYYYGRPMTASEFNSRHLR